MGRQLSRHECLRHAYWAGTPNQHRQTNRLYRGRQIGAAQRELSRSKGELFLAPGYDCVSHAVRLRRYCNTVLPNGALVCYKGDDGLRWLGKISGATPTDGVLFGSIFGRPGTDQASSFSGAQHGINKSCTRLLVSTNTLG